MRTSGRIWADFGKEPSRHPRERKRKARALCLAEIRLYQKCSKGTLRIDLSKTVSVPIDARVVSASDCDQDHNDRHDDALIIQPLDSGRLPDHKAWPRVTVENGSGRGRDGRSTREDRKAGL